jgi:hypothetical protein
MLPGSKTKALTLLVAVLVAGGALGWFANEFSERGERRPRSRGVDPLVARLTKELHLTSSQEDSVRAILTRRQKDARALWQEIHPRYIGLRERAKTEIEAQLTDEQKVHYEELYQQMERERARADSTRGDRR